ncbi:hypothetical protein [Streptococcus sp. DD13]|uniref:hypothetical protein n=1 Tax=Streptococcus sp. DD13 TaxID=1777881 RepID=UPI00079222DF|nr:hypothetical protein [Streptococcus sp. DD13]KXT78299.1 hypothetical protein STRDD13_00858 [Streptococcus sp. DD13]
MKTASFYEETTQLVAQIQAENSLYFNELWDYFNLAGFYYNERILHETIYNMACDFVEAEKDGATAEEYFGKAPKEMADQIIAEVPRESIQFFIKTSLLVAGIVTIIRLLQDFASQPVMVLRPLVFLTDILLNLLMIPLIFKMMARYLYEKGNHKQFVSTSLLFGAYAGLEMFAVRFLPRWGFMILPLPWDSLLVGALFIGLLAFQGRNRLMRPFLIVFIGFLCVGWLQRWNDASGMQDGFWKIILPIGIILVANILFHFYSYRLFKTEKKKENTK